MTVWFARLRFLLHVFLFFFFQPPIVDFVNCEQCICVLFTVPQITLFSNFFIKNGSHNTIYTFKNYFATVFSVSILIFSFASIIYLKYKPCICFGSAHVYCVCLFFFFFFFAFCFRQGTIIIVHIL